MIQILETTVNTIQSGTEKEIARPSIDQLFIELRSFNEQVKISCDNFQGPDCFDLHRSLKELNAFMDLKIERMGKHVLTLEMQTFTKSSSEHYPRNYELVEGVFTDADRVSNVVSGLGNLIQITRLTLIEDSRSEKVLSRLVGKTFYQELENRRWLFSMYSKYLFM
mgnify:CR=1 FL=1